MTRLDLFYPEKVTLDRRVDQNGLVMYFGDAHYSHGEGFYKCLAQVGDALCIVEVKLRYKDS